MGLSVLILGLVVFLGAHTFVTLRPARVAAVERLGRPTYLMLFSLASAVGLALIFWGFAWYRKTGWIGVWHPPDFMRHITIALVWPAAVLVTAAYLPGHIKRTVKHPMLAGVKLWAFAHLLSNGDLGGIVLFGSFLGWAVYDRIAVKRREAAGEPAAVMFVDRGWTNDIIAVALGSFLYLALGFAFHPVVIGVPVFGR
ncbi:MAG: NnrU family protein [Xanthobacteraceae bacterium]